jgi:hypothetical protein
MRYVEGVLLNRKIDSFLCNKAKRFDLLNAFEGEMSLHKLQDFCSVTVAGKHNDKGVI